MEDEAVPSGEREVVRCSVGSSSVNRVTAPVPSAACVKRFCTPARDELKKSRRLSRVQTG